jgi:nitrite transporter NirC
MRTTSEAGKLIMIWWCLFGFIGAGFEHSVANMTLMGIGLFQEHPSTISWGMDGFLHNLIPVTAGNIVGGAIFVGGAYWLSNANIRLGFPAKSQQTSAAPMGSAITTSSD